MLFVTSELTYEKLTVGKIYAGLLIAENWRAYKANKTIKMVNRIILCKSKLNFNVFPFT